MTPFSHPGNSRGLRVLNPGHRGCTLRVSEPETALRAEPSTQRLYGPWLPQPRVSVVVATHQCPAVLERCLRALCGQSLAANAFEVLVVDHAHDDATRDRVRACARGLPPGFLHYLRTPGRPGCGPAAARNAGWRQARAQLIAFTDDDAVPGHRWLEEGESALRLGGWEALAGRIVVSRPPGQDRRAAGAAAQALRCRAGTGFVPCNGFVSKWALSLVGGFDERFGRTWHEGADLLFRLEDSVGPVGYSDRAVVYLPPRREAWGAALWHQRQAFYDALLYRKQPARYRRQVGANPPWLHYAIVALVLAASATGLQGSYPPMAACLLVALAALAPVARARLRRCTGTPGQMAETLLTSVLIPFASVYWRLRGAWHFRVMFL